MKRFGGMAGALVLAMTLSVSAFAQQLGQGSSVYDIIRNDHKVITEDFQKVMQSDPQNRKDAINKLRNDLRTHMKAEERYLYPVLRDNDATKALAVQAQDEHTAAAAQLAKVSAGGDQELEMAQLAVLQELVNAHIRFEESRLIESASQVIDPGQETKITGQFKEVDK